MQNAKPAPATPDVPFLEGLIFPAYFASSDGRDQIKLISPDGMHAWVRLRISEDAADVATFRRRLTTLQAIQIIASQYRPSTEGEYLALLREVLAYYGQVQAQLAEQLADVGRLVEAEP